METDKEILHKIHRYYEDIMLIGANVFKYLFQPMSFTQQLQQCTRGGKTRPLSKLLSPLQSEPQSPIYASPPLSPVNDAPNIFGMLNHLVEFGRYYYVFNVFRCNEYLPTSAEA